MLVRLEIRDFALLREADLDLSSGLNVITGATGVGKTLLLAALDLLLGGRARAERLGAEGRASVAGLFRLDPALAADVGELAGAEVEDGEVLVRRTVEAGRNRCSINGSVATVATLRALGERLVDIHGQNEHQSLLRPAAQLEVLDRFAGLDGDRETFAAIRSDLAEAVDRLAALEADRTERASRIDYLEHVVREIDDAEPRPGEREEIETTLRRLRDAERYRETLAAAGDGLYEGDRSVADEIGAIVRRLREVADLDPEVGRIADALEESRVGVEEAAFALRGRTREADDDPARLAESEVRLDLLHDLLRKHGPTEEDVLARADEARTELATLRGEEDDHRSLRARIDDLAGRLAAAGEALVAARLEAGRRLAKEVRRELADLGMKGTKVEVVHRPAPADADPLEGSTATGPGRFEILVATNPGSEPLPLQRVASGGELARIMLAMKGRLARADRIPVLVFDEIDANVGGRLGAVVGTKLAALGRHRQVLCVTHLPQIAAFGDRHLRVTKTSGRKEAVTSVAVLDEETRVDELADMLGGDATAEAARAQAVALLDEAAQRPGAKA